jgi:hypothetical protein
MSNQQTFHTLKEYLTKIPGIYEPIGSGFGKDGCWWVKFGIDIHHSAAWNVIQELGHVLNYLSLQDKLPTVFMPVSPPPYLNGGPREYLSWVMNPKTKSLRPTPAPNGLKDVCLVRSMI